MKAKKIIALALTAAMAISTASLLAACDGDANNGGGNVDTNVYYAVGNDRKGTAKVNGWQPRTINEELKFKAVEGEENTYTLTMDIYAGDANVGYGFKFLYKTSEDEVIESDDEIWPRQFGIHAVDTVEGSDKDAVVKIDGVTVFTTTDGANANNMYLAKGQEGKYQFTLKTNPKENTKVISVSKLEAINIPYDMYAYGDINNFGWGSTANKWALTEKSETLWSGQFEVTAKDATRDAQGKVVEEGGQYAAVQLYNVRDKKTYVATGEDVKTATITVDDDSIYPAGTDKVFNLLEVGKYTVTFAIDGNTKTVTISKGSHDMYLIGGWYAEEGTDNYGWGYNDGYKDYHMTQSESDENIWTMVYYFEKATELKLYNALTNTYYTTPENIETDGNIKIEKAGKYSFRFNQETSLVEVEEIGYYIVGTFLDAEGNTVNFGDKGIIKDFHPKFTVGEGSMTATFEATDVTAKYSWVDTSRGVFVAQIVQGSTLVGVTEWAVANSGGNAITVAAGTWTITVDTTNWTYTVTAAAAQ